MQEVVPKQVDEKQLIEAAFQQLWDSIESKMTEEDRAHMQKAFEVAVEGHAPQRRKSGEPYVLHPIEVARICSEEIGLGPTAVVAALLHDVVEDTPYTLEQLQDIFGDRIAEIVDGLTKLDSAYNAENPQAENFRKVLRTLVKDVRVVLIKMADRLHNMRTLGAMPRHKQLKIASETLYIYAPLAHRLGLYNFKTEFHDLCMKIRDPETYRQIARKLNETKRARNHYINEFIKPLIQELDELNVPYRIAGRPKSIFSIYNKIKTKDTPFEEIYDLFAIRIIVKVPPKKEKSTCWLIYSTVSDIYEPIPERLKDWVSTPKSNGYESLHTTVIGPDGRYVEVQIRSERMDEIAERGFAAHWKYKGVSNQPDVYDKWLDSVRELLENKDGDAIEFINDFKTNLFNEEVYVYTPQGDLRVLPKGATALDFAFNIHSDLGYSCSAVKINNRLVPMGYRLRNGDQVSVMTNKNQRPNETWLKMVVTGKARSKIRSAMKEERKKQGLLGKEALQRKLQHMKVDFEEAVEKLVKYYRLKSHTNLYFAIATDQISVLEALKPFKAESGKLQELPPEEEPKKQEAAEPVEKKRPRKKIKAKPQLLINGQPGEQYNYTLSSCCNPVQGDDVFAFVSANSGLKIHRATCPNATHLMANYGYRIMKAEWISTTNTYFVADLVITGIDDGPGVIERLTKEISSQLGVNIRSFSIAANEGIFKGKVSLLVANKDQLYLVIKSLEKLDHVSTVTRAE